MSNLTYEGATPDQLSHALVHHFLAIHDMFRTQLRVMLDYIEELTSGEQQLTGPQTQAHMQSLIRAGSQYTQMLHGHHHGETSSLFPALQREGLADIIVDRLNAEHDEIGVMIDSFNVAIHNFAAVEPDVMNNDLRRLAEALSAHLAYEETHVCPLLTRFSNWPMH